MRVRVCVSVHSRACFVYLYMRELIKNLSFSVSKNCFFFKNHIYILTVYDEEYRTESYILFLLRNLNILCEYFSQVVIYILYVKQKSMFDKQLCN